MDNIIKLSNTNTTRSFPRAFAGLLAGVLACLLVLPAGAEDKLTRPEIKALTVSMYFPGTGVRLSDQWADDIHYLNATMIRMEFIGVPGPNKPIDYDAYDRVVRRLGDRGIGVLGLIDYASVPYGSDTEWETDAFREVFVERVREIVTHYHDFEYPITAWEIWNEPDLDVRHEGGPNYRVPPVPYARILIESYDAIKEIDPDATVIFGGVSPKGFLYDTNYFREVYESQPMADYHAEHGFYPFDAVGAHPYPETFTAPTPGMANALNQRVKAVMNEFGDSHKTVWITEMGWSSTTWQQTEAQQAQYLRDSFLLMDTLVDPAHPENGPYIETYFWFQYEDFGEPNADNWGLWTANRGRKKPAYDAFLNLTEPGRPEPTPTPPPDPTPTPGPGEQPPVYNETSDAALPFEVADDDLLAGMVGQIVIGGFHEATVGGVANLTNGQFDSDGLTVVLRDYPYPQPALRVRYTFPEPMDLTEVRIFAGHTGDGGRRAFQSNDIYINGELARQELNTGVYGQESPYPNGSAVSLVRWLPEEGDQFVATFVETLDVAMYPVTVMSTPMFVDRWGIDDPEDRDGLAAAFVSPIIKEIDAFGRPSPDQLAERWIFY